MSLPPSTFVKQLDISSEIKPSTRTLAYASPTRTEAEYAGGPDLQAQALWKHMRVFVKCPPLALHGQAFKAFVWFLGGGPQPPDRVSV